MKNPPRETGGRLFIIDNLSYQRSTLTVMLRPISWATVAGRKILCRTLTALSEGEADGTRTQRQKGQEGRSGQGAHQKTQHGSSTGHCPRYRTRHPRRSQGIGAGKTADAGVPRRWQNRGARRPRPKGFKADGGEPTAEDEGSFVPLQIFAEGDSWFDYPVPFFGGSIIPRLERRLGVPILNLAKAGDEARYMLGVEERAILTEHLTNGCPAGGPWDVLLFSGGGNDIVGNPMALWVTDWNPALPPAELSA